MNNGRGSGVRLRTVLLNLGIPHGDLAASAGVPFCDLSRFISGKRLPNVETKRKLAAGLRDLTDEENII